MSKTVRWCICALLALMLLLSAGPAVLAADRADEAIEETAAWLLANVPSPHVGSIGGEWAVFGLVRSGVELPAGYLESYYAALEAWAVECGGVLNSRKYTEYSRVILTLTALKRDPTDVAGYDFLLPLGDYDRTVYQGVSGAVFALLALDSAGYEVPVNADAATQATRALYVARILSCEHQGGGFSVSGNGEADADMTAMALAALAQYREQPAVNAAVERGLAWLSAAQGADGGFASYGTANCESVAQVIVALCELRENVDSPHFTKNGKTALDALLSYGAGGGGFAHERGGSVNGMATEQAFCALAAIKRADAGQTGLYNMSGAVPSITFADIAGHPARTAIEALASRGIINGMGDGAFSPDATMTRAQFAAIVVRGLGLTPQSCDAFTDIAADRWYAPYVGAAYASGIVRGASATTFEPEGTITVCEAEIMLARAARICALEGEEPAWFADPALIKRGQIAQKLFELLTAAELI